MGDPPAMAKAVRASVKLGRFQKKTLKLLNLLRGNLKSAFAAYIHFNSKSLHRRGLGSQRSRGTLRVGGVCHLDVIRAMASHELIASNSVEYGIHNRPLWRRNSPSPIGFARR